MPAQTQTPKTIAWVGGLDGYIELIDQTLLPERLEVLTCKDTATLWEAIKMLRVRGAPAIGVAAAMGVVLGTQKTDTKEAFFKQLDATIEYLAGSRPTAVNLFWALKRMNAVAEAHRDLELDALKQRLLDEAQAIREQDAATCRAIGQAGAPLINERARVMTHCNAGGLATAEYGTALAVMYAAHEQGRSFKVFADETRPLLQGSRLTAWELAQAGIDVTVVCDSMAGYLMKEVGIDLVVVGADRIAANGDAANKIGTYSLAVLARAHNVPFYVAAPKSTFDFSLPTGDDIPIEQRDPDEIRRGFGKLTAPAEVACFSPAFDVTPADLIEGLITEKGLVQPVTTEQIREVLGDA